MTEARTTSSSSRTRTASSSPRSSRRPTTCSWASSASSGSTPAGSPTTRLLLNLRTGKTAKPGHLYRLQGKTQEEVTEAIAGDIVAVAKFDDLHISDTVTSAGNGPSPHLKLDPIKFPTPMVPRAVEPKTREDEPKISVGLAKIADEDPTFTFRRDTQTHELVISGMSELHLDVIQNRLKNRFKLDINTHIPHVPYLETITATAEAHHRHKKQTGGRGQFADVQLRVRPRERGEGFNFVDAIKGGVIPNQFIPAVEKGVREQLEKGVISGNPVVDVEVEVFFGGYHAVDSSEQAFKTASAAAFRKAFLEARPVLLEPIVNLEVTVPIEKFGDISADLATRRGHITGMETLPGGLQVDPGHRAAQRGAPLRHRPQEHDRRPGLVHDGVPLLRARAAQRPADHRRPLGQVPGGHRGGVSRDRRRLEPDQRAGRVAISARRPSIRQASPTRTASSKRTRRRTRRRSR